ncbi:Uncharacterized protein PCOAH_00014360 [Plasmodium coatneyi]|uniref:Uncharacterized protein n=1 Tax=Plasmodium coatneyi TaxID=208452 RepID=A0A1B1DWD2_9APIC|nr:Uncharacterized protein PCOAH_00014360 [Plasmodium coatneyi]ANQ07060.1 Uncharacterized protein PCOAH_00014360 [Plasmodium coatneyi]
MKSLKIKGLVKGKDEAYYNLVTVISLNDEELDEQIIKREESVKANWAAIKNAKEISKSEKKLFGEIMRNERVRLRVKGNIKKVTRRREELSEHYRGEALNCFLDGNVSGDKKYMKEILNYLRNVQGVKFHGNVVKRGRSTRRDNVEEGAPKRLYDQRDVTQRERLLRGRLIWRGEEQRKREKAKREEVKADNVKMEEAKIGVHQTNSSHAVKGRRAKLPPLRKVKNKAIQKKKGKKKSMRASQNVVTEPGSNNNIAEKTLRRILQEIKMSLKELKKPRVVIQSSQKKVDCRTKKQEERHSVIYNLKQDKCVGPPRNNCPVKKSPNYEQHKLYFKGLFQHIRGGKKGSLVMASSSKGKIIPTVNWASIGAAKSAKEEDPLCAVGEDDTIDITCEDEFEKKKFVLKEKIKDEYRRKRKESSIYRNRNEGFFPPDLVSASNERRSSKYMFDETALSESDRDDLEYLVSVKGKNARRYEGRPGKEVHPSKEQPEGKEATGKPVRRPPLEFSPPPDKQIGDSPPGGNAPLVKNANKERAQMKQQLNHPTEYRTESCVKETTGIVTHVGTSVVGPVKDNAVDGGNCSDANNPGKGDENDMGKNAQNGPPQMNGKKNLAGIMKSNGILLKKHHGRKDILREKKLKDDAQKGVKDKPSGCQIGEDGTDKEDPAVVGEEKKTESAFLGKNSTQVPPPVGVKTEHGMPKESTPTGDALKGKKISPPVRAPGPKVFNNPPRGLVSQNGEAKNVGESGSPVMETSGMSEEREETAAPVVDKLAPVKKDNTHSGAKVEVGRVNVKVGLPLEKVIEASSEGAHVKEANPPSEGTASMEFPKGGSKPPSIKVGVNKPDGSEAGMSSPSGEAAKEEVQNDSKGESKKDLSQEEENKVDAEIEKGNSASSNSEVKNGGGNKIVASVKVPLKLNNMVMKKALLGKMLAKRVPKGTPPVGENKEGKTIQEGKDNKEGEASEKNKPMEKVIPKTIPKSKAVIPKVIPPKGVPLKGNAILKAKVGKVPVAKGSVSFKGEATEVKTVEEKVEEEKAVEVKAVEEKVVEEKAVEVKAVEEKVIEEKIVEEEKVEEKNVEEEKVEEEKVEEKNVEEEKVEEEKVEEKNVEEEKVEEEKVEEKKVEEKKVEEEKVVEEKVVEENVAEEKVIEEKSVAEGNGTTEEKVPLQVGAPTVKSVRNVKYAKKDEGVPKGENNSSERGFIENAVRKNIERMLERTENSIVHVRDEKNGKRPSLAKILMGGPKGLNVMKSKKVKGGTVLPQRENSTVKGTGDNVVIGPGSDAECDVPPTEGRKRYSVTLNKFSKKIEVKKKSSVDVVELLNALEEKSGEDSSVRSGLPGTDDAEKVTPPSVTTADELPKRTPMVKPLVKKDGLAKLTFKRTVENKKAPQLGEEDRDKQDGEQKKENQVDEKGEGLHGEETHSEGDQKEEKGEDPPLPKKNVVKIPLLPPKMKNAPFGQPKGGPSKNNFMAKLQMVKNKSTMKQFPLKKVAMFKPSGEESSPNESGNIGEKSNPGGSGSTGEGTSPEEEQNPQVKAEEDTTTKEVNFPPISEKNENEAKDNSDNSSEPLFDTKKCPVKKMPPKSMVKILPKIPPKVVTPFSGVKDAKHMTKVKPPFLNKLKAKALPPPSMRREDTEKGLSEEEKPLP